jgi:hypothetical protein
MRLWPWKEKLCDTGYDFLALRSAKSKTYQIFWCRSAYNNENDIKLEHNSSHFHPGFPHSLLEWRQEQWLWKINKISGCPPEFKKILTLFLSLLGCIWCKWNLNLSEFLWLLFVLQSALKLNTVHALNTMEHCVLHSVENKIFVRVA